MITKEQFTDLPILERAAVVLECGCELCDRIYMSYIIKLYQVDDFYVELWYRHNGNKIDKLDIVEWDDVIHHYEKVINIQDLFHNC
ncbi:MAG: hypothetical protein U1C46_07110 [Bacteroidales bacterium]|nr:hypothetical protein [Bacteroidales bacterium]